MRRFWFDGDAQFAPIGTLSGGERRRLQLLLTLVEQPNVLLLDEPTNDLDLDTLRALEDFLDDWPGIVVTVSHDRAFLDRVTDELLALDGDGGVRWIRGGVGAWLAQRAARRRRTRCRRCRATRADDRRGASPLRRPQPVDPAPLTSARPSATLATRDRRPRRSWRRRWLDQRPLGAVDAGRAAGRRPGQGRRAEEPGWPSPPRPKPSASTPTRRAECSRSARPWRRRARSCGPAVGHGRRRGGACMRATSSQRVELAADLALDADQLEAAAIGGARSRRRSLAVDAGEHGVEAATPRRRRAARSSEQLADALAVAVAADVDRVLDAGAVGGPLLVRRQRPEADDVAVLVGRDRRRRSRRTPRAVGDPLLLVVQRARHEVERGRPCCRPRGCRSCGSARHRPGRRQIAA